MKKILLLLTLALCAPMSFAQSLPSYVPADGLVGYWPFNGNANDESGNGNNGTIVGGVSNTSDRFGSPNAAYYFDGVNGHIEIPSLNTQPYTPITYSGWVIVNSYFPSSFGHKFRAIIGRNTAYIIDNGVIGFYANKNENGGAYDNTFLNWRGGGIYGDGAVPYSASIPPINTWLHVVYTQSLTGDWKWYQNGILTNSGNFTDAQNDFNYFQIGGCNNQSDGNTFWNDKLDDIGIWNRALTQEEITQLYTSTPAPTASSQTFCGPTTVASLAATGTDLKWYATATGGLALAPSETLVTQTYYVSQTLNTIESTRTAVVVTVNEAQISASANTVSSGTAVALTANSGATNSETNSCIGNIGTPNPWSYPNAYDGGYIPLGNVGAQTVFSISMWVNPGETQNGISILLDASHGGSSNWVIQAFGNNTYTWGNMSFDLTPNVWQHLLLTYDNGHRNCYINGQLTRTLYQVISYSGSPNLYLGNWPEGARRFNGLVDELYITNTIQQSSNFTPLSTIDSAGSNCFGLWHFDEGSGSYSLNTASSQNINIGSWNWSTRSNLNTTYAWSTGETTATINPSPTTTTTYWCDVTANGVTCRKELTVTVRPLAPTATAQTFCASATVNSLVATGTDVKWYTAETGGTALASDVTLVSGTYYVSQTLNTIESDRTAVVVTVNDALITASANSVSSGTAVELKINQQNISSPNYSLYHQAGGYFADSNNDNYVVFPVSSTLNTNYSSWTMECWAKIMSPSEEGILSIGNPEHGGGNAIYSGWSNVFGAYSNSNEGGAGAVSSYNYTPAVWNHFALSYQNGTYRLFLNGILKESWVSGSSVVINNMYPFMTNTHWWWRGGDLSSHRMTVYYDDIRVSKVCRYTSDFIPNTNWNNDTNTIGLWNFNEGSGNTVLDYSGNLNNGIIHGATYSSDVPETSVNNVNLSNSYLWSTGETTASINPSPTATTTYWCDVTVNGVTCRKEMTITVTAKLEVISPINYCHKSTAVPLTATPTTGSTLKWYTTTTSKTALATAPTPMTTPVGSKTYYVAERNAAGVESERLPIVVNINPLPTTPNAIQLTEGSNSITKVGPYIGTTTPLTLSISAANATSFDWILPKGVLVTSAVNSSTTDADGVTTANASGSITINFSGVTAGLGTLFISVKSVGNCGTSAERKIALTRVILSTPGTISTTNSNVCFGIVGTANKVTYSIAPVAGAFAQGYTWTVPTGATIETPVANVLTMTYGTEIEVSYDSSFVSGAVSVKASNGVGMSKIKTLSVVRRVPFNIASITGPVTFCVNKTATISVPSVAGVTYSWSATNNTILTAQGNSVTASFANTSSISAYTSVTVTQNNGCGFGASKKITLSRGSCATTKIASQDKTPSQLFTAMAYPNPSSTAFEVTTNTEKAFGVKVYDLLGRLIEEQHTKGATLKIGANYQSGTYILKVSQGENQKTLQVIKK